MSTVIFDLDSTLADTRHRRGDKPLAPTCAADWEDYHSRCADDPPIEGRIALARLLAEHHDIVIVTARTGTNIVRTRTLAWLHEHDVPFDRILFMPEDTPMTLSTGEWKAVAVEEVREAQGDVVLFVDDWWQNCDEVERLGVPVLHVTPPGIGRPQPVEVVA